MPRRRGDARLVEHVKPVEPEPVKTEEQVDLYDKEEVEYEEVEEEVEFEEVEEEEEIEVIEEVEEEEEEEEEKPSETIPASIVANNQIVKRVSEDEDEKKKHAELLALPPHGSEVYIGGIPSGATEEDVRNFCQRVGEVVKVRTLRGKDGESNRYAFVTFRSKEMAAQAVRELKFEELKGKNIKMISISDAKNKLFIGDIPREWHEVDLKAAVEKVGPGVIKVEIIKNPQTNRNRGFAFVEYHNHDCAEYSRKKMCTPGFAFDKIVPTISWADPKTPEPQSSVQQVKSLYVKNLPKDVTETQIRELFQRHGEITKVILPPAKAGHENRYGFVHFKERPMAMRALKNTERYELNGQLLDCSIAKPHEAKGDARSGAKSGTVQPSFPAGRYSYMAAPYATVPAGFAQPMVYAPTSPSVAMVPMIFPDGRMAYVLQQQPPIGPIQPEAAIVQQRVQQGRRPVGPGPRHHQQQKVDHDRGSRYRPY